MIKKAKIIALVIILIASISTSPTAIMAEGKAEIDTDENNRSTDTTINEETSTEETPLKVKQDEDIDPGSNNDTNKENGDNTNTEETDENTPESEDTDNTDEDTSESEGDTNKIPDSEENGEDTPENGRNTGQPSGDEDHGEDTDNNVINLDVETEIYGAETAQIGNTGSTISIPFDIPEGITILISDVSETDMVQHAVGLERAGSAFSITVNDTGTDGYSGVFSLTIPFDSSIEEDKGIYSYQNNDWKKENANNENGAFTVSRNYIPDGTTFGVFAFFDEESETKHTEIRNDNLREMINHELNKPASYNPTTEDMKQLKELDADRKTITTLEGLEHAVNLERLNLHDVYRGETTLDISPLENLVNLKSLSIGSNKIDSFQAIANLVNLEELGLGSTGFSDLEVIKELTRIRKLTLSRNDIVDITQLKDLIELRELDLSNNKVVELDPLKDMFFLMTLNLQDNNVSQLNSLKDNVFLTHLNLSNNQVEDIAPLTEIGKIKELTLDYNPISNFSPLEELVKLESLSLKDLGIEDIRFLEGLKGLHNLDLMRNNITDILSLGKLYNLRDLNIRYNLITDISPIYSSFGPWLEKGYSKNIIKSFYGYNQHIDLPALNIPKGDSIVTINVPSLINWDGSKLDNVFNISDDGIYDSSTGTITWDNLKSDREDITFYFSDPDEHSQQLRGSAFRGFMRLPINWTSEEPDDGYTIPPGVSTVVTRSQELTVEDEDGNAAAVVETPNDLPDGTTILLLEKSSESEIVAHAKGIKLSGKVFEITLSAPPSSFEDTFTLTLPYDTSILEEQDIYYYNEETGEWVKQNGDVDSVNGTITIYPSHFSTYGVFAVDEEDMNEEENQTGIEIDASNITLTVGDSFDSYSYVSAYINGNRIDDIEIDGEVDTKTPGEYTITYKVTDHDTGEFKTKEITVTVKPKEEQEEPEKESFIKFGEETKISNNQVAHLGDTGTILTMPGDLPANSTILVTNVGESEIVSNAKRITRGGDVFSFILNTPKDTSFNKTFTLTIPYGNGITTEMDIYHYIEETGEWEGQNGDIDPVSGTITIYPSGFSTYGVFAAVDNESDESDESDENDENNEDSENNGSVGSDDESNNKNGKDPKEEKSSSIIEVSVSNHSGNGDVQEAKKENDKLPATATTIFNWILIGLALITTGFVLMLLKRRRLYKQE